MTGYRKKIYDRYIDSHIASFSDFSEKEYDYYRRLIERNYMRHLPEDKDADIIELGCGTGYFLEFLRQKGYRHYTGVDISPQMVNKARERGLNVIQADIFDFMRESNDRYDVIIARHLIEHLQKNEIITLLDMIHRSLKEGGIVILETPNASSPAGTYIRYCDFTHEISFVPMSLRQVLISCGFKQCSIYPLKDVSIFRRFIFGLLNLLIKPISKGQIMMEWVMIGIAKK